MYATTIGASNGDCLLVHIRPTIDFLRSKFRNYICNTRDNNPKPTGLTVAVTSTVQPFQALTTEIPVIIFFLPPYFPSVMLKFASKILFSIINELIKLII